MTFLKSTFSFAKLEYRARFYPSSFVLAVVQSLVTAGMWFFVSLFLKNYARHRFPATAGILCPTWSSAWCSSKIPRQS